MTIQAKRYHDICCGHRVYKHESKCSHLHGHNYRIHFVIEAAIGIGSGNTTHDNHGLDGIGRVLDFSVIKEKLCEWLEENWDHRFLIWEEDPMSRFLLDIDSTVVLVPFNPTAENMAEYIVNVLGPTQLAGTGTFLSSVTIDETAKCSATYIKD